MSCFSKKWIAFFIPVLSILSCSAVQAMSADYKGEENVSTSQPNNVFNTKALPYFAFSGGYGTFQNSLNASGQTPFGRAAFGSLWNIYENASLGAEFGLQSGNRMQLSNKVGGAFGYNVPFTLFLTIKPPIDFLAVAKYEINLPNNGYFNMPIFIQAKGGAVYLRTMSDSSDVPSKSVWQPELQLGLGLHLTENSRAVLSFQEFFGQNVTLSNVNSTTGTANINHMPSWRAGMISYEISI